jgi:DHA2 family multidrug resistance protein-like MFS transporter
MKSMAGPRKGSAIGLSPAGFKTDSMSAMSATAAHEGTPAKATRKEWIGLGVIALPCLLYSMDMNVLNLAVPSLARDLDPTPSQMLWIIDIYGFMVAGFLMVMGSLGDRIGRRKILMIGAVAFGAASILAAFAQTAEQLIAARAVLGIAGATVAPSTLSLISNMFRDEGERTFAISMWIMAFSVGGIIGPAVGGILIEWFWWGAVFLIAVPVMVLLLIAAPLLLPEFKDPKAGRIDILSALMSLTAVLSVVYAIKHAAEHGIDMQALLALVSGVAVAALFLRRQKRLADPFLDLDLFKSAPFSLAVAINTLTLFFMFGVWILMAQAFQLVFALSPLQAGLWSLPSAIAFAAMSPFNALLVSRFGQVNVLTAGLVIAALGVAGMAMAPSLVLFVAGGVVMALGMTPVFGITVSIVVGTAPPEKSGVASALSETGAELGGATGIAVLGSILTVLYRSAMAGVDVSALPPEAAEAARRTLPGAVEHLAAPGLEVALAAARAGFMNGFTFIALGSAFAMLVLAFIARRVFAGITLNPDPAH